MEVPWFFIVLGVLVWVAGVFCLFKLVSNLVWALIRGVWLVVCCWLESLGGLAYWAVGVLGRWLGMEEEEEGRKEVPIVIVEPVMG